MEVDSDVQEDAFPAFVEYARSVLLPEAEEENYELNDRGEELVGPGWSWIAGRILRTCMAYSSGVTAAILLSDLSQVRTVKCRACEISRLVVAVDSEFPRLSTVSAALLLFC